MKKNNILYLLAILILLTLSCSFFQETAEISGPDFSAISLEASASYQLDERLIYEVSGYSLQPITGYDIIPIDMQDGAQAVILHDPLDYYSIYFYGTKSDGRFESLDELLVFWIPALTENDPNGELSPVSDYPVRVDGIEGIAVNITGQISDKPLTGQVIAFMVSENHYLYALGFSDAEEHKTLWEDNGLKALHTLVSTVEFLE